MRGNSTEGVGCSSGLVPGRALVCNISISLCAYLSSIHVVYLRHCIYLRVITMRHNGFESNIAKGAKETSGGLVRSNLFWLAVRVRQCASTQIRTRHKQSPEDARLVRRMRGEAAMPKSGGENPNMRRSLIYFLFSIIPATACPSREREGLPRASIHR